MFLHACETVIDIVEVGQVEYRRAEEWTSGAVEDTSLAGTATPSPATEPQQAVAQPVNDFSDVSPLTITEQGIRCISSNLIIIYIDCQIISFVVRGAFNYYALLSLYVLRSILV